ncbi:MAG: hypothetical protein GY802_13420 [Gammaproteobacteria bacterium]|nr:hypothetical protein [Gammaproteobacteria bacterium]
MLARHYSPRTIEAYLYWIKYYIHYHREDQGVSVD